VAVFDLVATRAVLVGMGKDDVGAGVDQDATGETGMSEQFAGNRPVLFQIPMR